VVERLLDHGVAGVRMQTVLHGWAELFRDPRGAILPAIVGAIPHDPELAQAFREDVIGWRKEEIARTIARKVLLPFVAPVRQPASPR
jgi:hypothetical protein